ncbi:MAG: zinc-binding dehydrogenase [Verrucomicrobiales bacterium]|jgi:threonine dehydrogenase-like Zn-dependent dehydrogenase
METKIAFIEKPGGPVRVESCALPELEQGAVLLRTRYSEVCGTDCHLFHGKLAGVPYPLTPGHVSVGEIESIRGIVKDVDGRPFAIGDLVTFLDVHETCGSCWYCLVAKAATRCPERRVYGITYGTDEGLLGGWSQHIYLKPGVKLIRIPEGLEPRTFIAGGCGMPTAFHAVERAEIQLGDTVVVQGSGPVGLSTVAFARMAGAGEIILLGAPEKRLALGQGFGADDTLNISQLTSTQRVEAILERTQGRGADVVIEASGSPAAVAEGVQMARDAGRYVIVGQYTDNGDVTINPHSHINKKHLDIRGCWGSEFTHVYRSVAMMARTRNRLDWSAMISQDYGLHEAAQGLSDVENLRVIKAIIDPWKE